MNRDPRNPHKKAFDAIALEAVKALRAYLANLSDDEAKKAAKIASGISRTNCFWYLWELRGMILEEIRSDACGRSNARKALEVQS